MIGSWFGYLAATCNPTVDIVFMLDGQSSVSASDFQKQKNFIQNILERHESPAGAVQVNRGVMTSSYSGVPVGGYYLLGGSITGEG